MGWFDEQIRQRKQSDEDTFDEAIIRLAGSVMGQRLSAAIENDKQLAEDALNDILRFYHIRPKELPDDIKDFEGRMEYLFRPHGIMRRAVSLKGGWYQDAYGAMLGTRKSDGSLVTFLPGKMNGYRYYNRESGKCEKVTSKNEELFEREALCFYKPLPLKKITVSELFRFLAETVSVSDYVMFAAAAFAAALVGILLPKLNAFIFSDVIAAKSTRVIIATAVFLLGITVSKLMIESVKDLFLVRIKTKMSFSAESAAMMRILSLPADFFKQYSSGDLSQRVRYITGMCGMITDAVLNTVISAVFALVYISQIGVYAPALIKPSAAVIAVSVMFSLISAAVQTNISRKQIELAAKESGITYAIFSGIQKIRLAGAEKRAFAKWAKIHAESSKLKYSPPMIIKANSAMAMAISLWGMWWIQITAYKSGVSVSDYYAFNTAFGMITMAFAALSNAALKIANIKPVVDLIKPIMDTEPEISESKQVISRLSGSIELNNVTFRYNENMPPILDNMSLKIRPGQYVAVVGKTGCGKSTLMRILLGFEKPQKGAVYYDGRDINTIDLKSLRRKIGVVMQNGKLFQGDIYSNMVINAPQLTLDEAWTAAECAGIADDIRSMPMGMHTLVSEGSGGISGGQRQRIMIARAIAPKPKILMLDEATSALDNKTQKTVSDSLDKLKCTRIVIAHRLSTIRQCDRIIVLDSGKIIEDGTYDELIAQNGFFKDLVERQRADI